MAKINLKNIVGKKTDTNRVITDLASRLGINLWIEDDRSSVLLGEQGDTPEASFPIRAETEIIGWVKGDEEGSLVAELLSSMAAKEAEKKKLGAEVLNMYQEINVIFNFSEKLTHTIEPDAIARITLDQAMHSIPGHSGVIILWDEENKELNVPAITEESLFNRDQVKSNVTLLLKIGLSGQSEIINDLSKLKEKGIIDDSVQSLIYAAMKVKRRIMGAIILAGKDTDQFSASHLKLLVTLALQSSAAIESALLYEKNIREVREREEAILRIHEVTKKFVPHEFIRSLGKDTLTEVRLGDQVEKIVTVLFTDIRDFTSLSEKMTPEENFHFVSSFNARLGPIIRSHGGFINQYLGDSIMAIFPVKTDDALHAAIMMQVAINELNRERSDKGLPPIKAGIGMHTGPLIMGITGDEFRLDAATISDTVNTAARIESLTKYYRSPLLLSEDTLNTIENPATFNVRRLGSVRLKGKNQALTIIECLNGFTPISLDRKLKTLSWFEEAMTDYQEQKFETAIRLFHKILDTDPEDQTVQHYLEKANRFIREGIPDNWTGAEEMITK